VSWSGSESKGIRRLAAGLVPASCGDGTEALRAPYSPPGLESWAKAGRSPSGAERRASKSPRLKMRWDCPEPWKAADPGRARRSETLPDFCEDTGASIFLARSFGPLRT